MKKLPLFLICAMLLTGCASNESSSSGSKTTSADTTASSTDSASDSAEASSLSDAAASEGSQEEQTAGYGGEHDFSKISFKVYEDKVGVLVNGVEVQTLEADCKALLAQTDSEPEHLLNRLDFNFDGLEDLFVPAEVGSSEASGKYFRYEPGADEYVEWKELNNIGYYVLPEYKSRTLIFMQHSSATEFVETTYHWESGNIIPEKKVVQFINRETFTVLRDTYEYQDGKETHVRRQNVVLDGWNADPIDLKDVPLNYGE